MFNIHVALQGLFAGPAKKGQTLLEYSLIFGFIIVVCVGTVILLGQNVDGVLTDFAEIMSGGG